MFMFWLNSSKYILVFIHTSYQLQQICQYQSSHVSTKISKAKNDKIGLTNTSQNKLTMSQNQQSLKNKCFHCGQALHQAGVTCPHRNSICRYCQGPGHIACVCRKPLNQHNTRQQTYNQLHFTKIRPRTRTTHYTIYDPDTE